MHRLVLTTLVAAVVMVAAGGCNDESEEPAGERDAGADADPAAESAQQILPTDQVDPEQAGPEPVYVESTDTAGVISEHPPLDAESHFDAQQAGALIDVDAPLETAPLAGQPASETHNSVRYTPEDDAFGAALQVWDLAEADDTPDARLEQLEDQFLSVDTLDHGELPDGAFSSQRAGILTVVFAAEDHPYVFALSCETDRCEQDELTEAATEIAGR